MAFLNMQKAQEALKLYYLPGLRYQLNTANPILAVVERDKESVVGSEIRMALRYGRQGGVGMRADDGILPTPNSRKTKQASWATKNIFARIQISDKTMRASRGRDGAFVPLLQAELEDAQMDAKDQLDRMVFGDGTGVVTTTAANTGVTTLAVTNSYDFAEGQYIDLVAAADGTSIASEREITSVDLDANTITISGAAVTTASGDYVVMSGNYGEEITGLGAVMTPDNTLYNIDRSVNKWFNPVVDNIAGELTEVGIQKNVDNAKKRAGGKTNFLISSFGVRRAYQDLLLATKRTTDVMQLKGGYEALKVSALAA